MLYEKERATQMPTQPNAKAQYINTERHSALLPSSENF